MGRGKIAMRFRENARARAKTYATRTAGLKKKAKELHTLCGVRVALVCAPAAGEGSRLVWESEEGGVLDRYRALPPETRARHTHRSYLEAELDKERAKLARARQGASHGALADWDPALNDMTLDETLEVLGAIDANLRATGDRMAALGLPADCRLEEQVVLAPGDDDASQDAVIAPEQLMDMDYAAFQPQMMAYHGGSNDHVGGGNYYDAGAVYYDEEAPAGYGDNAGCGWPDLTMCYSADESCNAVMPAGYYPDFVDGDLAPEEHYSAQDVTGGDYTYTLPLEYPMGMDENFAYLGMDNSYAGHCQAEEFQSCDTGTGHYQYQCTD